MVVDPCCLIPCFVGLLLKLVVPGLPWVTQGLIWLDIPLKSRRWAVVTKVLSPRFIVIGVVKTYKVKNRWALLVSGDILLVPTIVLRLKPLRMIVPTPRLTRLVILVVIGQVRPFSAWF